MLTWIDEGSERLLLSYDPFSVAVVTVRDVITELRRLKAVTKTSFVLFQSDEGMLVSQPYSGGSVKGKLHSGAEVLELEVFDNTFL